MPRTRIKSKPSTSKSGSSYHGTEAIYNSPERSVAKQAKVKGGTLKRIPKAESMPTETNGTQSPTTQKTKRSRLDAEKTTQRVNKVAQTEILQEEKMKLVRDRRQTKRMPLEPQQSEVASLEEAAKQKIPNENITKGKPSVRDDMKHNVALSGDNRLLEDKASSEAASKSESSSEVVVRRSSRARTSKSALELLGVRAKNPKTTHQSDIMRTGQMAKKMVKSSKHVTATEECPKGEKDVDELLGTGDVKKKSSIVDKLEGGRADHTLSDAHEIVRMAASAKKEDTNATDVKLNAVGNLVSSLKSEGIRQGQDCMESEAPDSGTAKNPAQSNESESTEAYPVKDCKHQTKDKPEKNLSELVSADVTSRARLSRSGRVISSPKKYHGYNTSMGKGGKSTDVNELAVSGKAGLSPLSGTSRKRGSKSSSDDQTVKKRKVDSDVVHFGDDSTKLVTGLSNMKFENANVRGDRQGFNEDLQGNGQLMQAEVSPEGVITLTECILDNDGNAVKVNGRTGDLTSHPGEDVSSLASDVVQSDCMALAVAVKTDPDEQPDTVELCNIELSGTAVTPQQNEDVGSLVGEEHYESLELLVSDGAQEVTGATPDHVVVVSSNNKTEAGDLTYEALIKLASEAVNQVESYDDNMIYQVQLGNGKVTHFMFKKQDDKVKESNNAGSKVLRAPSSRKPSDERDIKLLTSEELEKQEQLLGKTLKGRSRPVKQMVVKKELQELVDNLKPSDSIEQHVIIESNCREKDLTSGSYKVRSKQMKCKYCNKLLHDRHDFYKHIRTHPEVDYRPYACPLCDYKANIKAAVVRHINIHSEVMPYVCTVCGRGFNFKQKLQTHMKYHKDIRDYQCPKCPLAFHEYKTLKNHIRIIHGPSTLMPSGEEAKGLRHRVTTLSRLAATRPQQNVKGEESFTNQAALNKDVSQAAEGDEIPTAIDTSVKTSAIEASPVCQDTKADDGKTFSSKLSVASEVSICQDHGEEQDAISRTSQDDVCSRMDISGNNSDVENTPSDVMYMSSERRRIRMSKYIGTKKTQIITERYREGLTKFGASHEEIAASCPWRSSNKLRHRTAGLENTSMSPNHVIAVEYEPNVHVVNESISITASGQESTSSDVAADGSALVADSETAAGVDERDKAVDESAQRGSSSTLSSDQKRETPVVCIQPLEHTDRPPPQAIPKTPFVSLKNLTSTFTEVCQEEKCKDDNQSWWRYRCRLCDHITYNKTFMVDHIQTRHTSIKLWQCPSCNYKCRLRSSIFVHLKMHEGNKKYKCEQCGKCYTLYSKLKNHLYTHSTNAEFKCEQCDKKFKRRSDLKKHEDRIHNPDRPFRCEVCDKTFKDKVQIKRHMDSHIEGKNLLCQICKKYYKNRSSLQQHLKSHMCRFYCELCNKSFGSYSGFMAHKVMHTESFTGFHCDLCGKVLHTKGSLNRHLTISHSTARPYPCLQCKSAFKTKKDLRNHAIVHCSTKNFECSVCGFKSKRCESLHVHMRRHQDVKPYRCGICDKEYMQRRSLQLHLPYHLTELQLRCNICNKRCMTRSHLQQHKKREHDVIETDVGNEDITKKNSATFYMCEECNSVFLTQDSLAVHILVQHMNQPHDLKVQLKSADAAAVTSSRDGVNRKSESEETEGSTCDVDMNSVDVSEDRNVIDSLFNIVNPVDCKESVAQYVAVTDPKSKEKRIVTVMHPISDGMMPADTAQNVEVEGEVVMNIGDTLADISGAMNNIKMEPLPEAPSEESIHSVLHDNGEAVVTVPMDAVSMAFVMPKDIDYPQVGDPESIVSFMDPSTNEEFSVSMPPQTLVNLLTPAMETEVVSSITDEDLSTPSDATLVSAEDNVIVSLADTVNRTNSDNSQGFSSVIESMDNKNGF